MGLAATLTKGSSITTLHVPSRSWSTCAPGLLICSTVGLGIACHTLHSAALVRSDRRSRIPSIRLRTRLRSSCPRRHRCRRRRGRVAAAAERLQQRRKHVRQQPQLQHTTGATDTAGEQVLLARY